MVPAQVHLDGAGHGEISIDTGRRSHVSDVVTLCGQRLLFTVSYVPDRAQDCFKKEDALYARFMASAITAMRYQCRIGVIAAGDHGCPQVGADDAAPLPSCTLAPMMQRRCPRHLPARRPAVTVWLCLSHIGPIQSADVECQARHAAPRFPGALPSMR